MIKIARLSKNNDHATLLLFSSMGTTAQCVSRLRVVLGRPFEGGWLVDVGLELCALAAFRLNLNQAERWVMAASTTFLALHITMIQFHIRIDVELEHG